MQSKVARFMERNKLLTKGATVLIGVSGGPDSMALLHYYVSIREEWELSLIAVSIDHQLRGDASSQDVAYVKEICSKWGVQFADIAVDVQSYKEQKRVGTQVAARELRYQSFGKQMDIHNADYLALGHHADDQVETMLMTFVRSASTLALSGIPVTREFHGGKIVRPFLCVTKADIQEYCAREKIDPRIDMSNQDTHYTRNYFRKYIIPMIKERNSNVHTTIQRLSETLRGDEQLLQDQARAIFQEVAVWKEDKYVSLQINRFKSYPHALQRRVYHLILDYLYHELPDNLSYTHEDIFFKLLEGDKGHTMIDFPSNLQIERSYKELNFFFKNTVYSQATCEQILQIPGSVQLPDGGNLVIDYAKKIPKQDQYTLVCHAEHVSLPLAVRVRKQGDKMSWRGLSGTKKLKDIFIDEKIPRRERDKWPIVIDQSGRIIWLIGLKKSKQSLQTYGEPLYIILKYEKANIQGD